MITPAVLRIRYPGESGGLFCQPAGSGFSFVKLQKVPGGYHGIEEAGICSVPVSEMAASRLLAATDTLLGRI